MEVRIKKPNDGFAQKWKKVKIDFHPFSTNEEGKKPFGHLPSWLREHCKGDVMIDGYEIMFEHLSDATFFKLNLRS